MRLSPRGPGDEQRLQREAKEDAIMTRKIIEHPRLAEGKARAADSARLAIIGLDVEIDNVMDAIAGLREAGLAEPHHLALEASLTTTMDRALEDWHEAERVSVAQFNATADGSALLGAGWTTI
jgi:hypothetical protein